MSYLNDLDALWVSTPANVRYLSGFSTPEDAKVLLLPEKAILYTDARYTVQAGLESSIEFFIARGADVYQHAKTYTQGKRVGFEADHLTVSGLEALNALEFGELIGTQQVLEQQRIIKTPEEVQKIRTAQTIADEALQAVVPQLKAGMTERDVALALEIEMRKRGAEDRAFDIIVASGQRSAMPHGLASNKVIEEGDLLTIDMGVLYQGYHSDMTRAYPVGNISEQLKTLYRLVHVAMQRAVDAVKPGITGKELDAIARDYLNEQGYGQYFVHSLGHGVGLNIHEAPALSRLSGDVLQAGMVVTVEPGLYLPEVGGVRLEQLVLVTDSGHEVLSQSPIPEI